MTQLMAMPENSVTAELLAIEVRADPVCVW